jgi:hypothetical protein
MLAKKDRDFLTMGLHHLRRADTCLFQGIKFLIAVIERDQDVIEQELLKIYGHDNPEEYKREIGRITNKLKRQWLDSRTTKTHHSDEPGCECHLCLIEKLKQHATLPFSKEKQYEKDNPPRGTSVVDSTISTSGSV